MSMKSIIYLYVLFFSFALQAQVSDPLIAMNSNSSIEKPSVAATAKKQFSGSESSDYSFIVNSNIKENLIRIETNYSGEYRIRFVGYYGRTRKVYNNVYSNKTIDVSDFEKGIFIMNITDEKNNKILSSQVINLKRRSL